MISIGGWKEEGGKKMGEQIRMSKETNNKKPSA